MVTKQEASADKKGDKDLMTSVARSTSYNIALQLMFRVSTFIINAIVLRHVTKDMLGIVNVRLTLLYSTTLFIGREAFRRSCVSKMQDAVCWQEIINIVWLSPLLGGLAAAGFSYIWLYNLELPDPEHLAGYKFGVVCFALSAVLEMVCEPMYIIGQKLLYVRFAALLEGGALICKSVVTIILVINYPQLGIVAFCVAQLTFTLIFTGGYFFYFGYLTIANQPGFPFNRISQLLPSTSENGMFINRHLASLTWSFQKQSVLKQLLTEGERYVMTVFNILSFADQGVFDVVSNLGSLVARFLFRPIEDSSYLLFTQSITRGTPASEQDKDALHTATEVLGQLLKVLTLIGLTILVFGYSYSQLALHIYGGQVLSIGPGPILLRWYSVYVLLMAINGLTECFSFATMSQQDIDRYNYKMLGFSAAFLAASLMFTNLFGSSGFIIANCCNLLVRTIHSVYVIEAFYKQTAETPLKNSLIDLRVLAVYVAVFLITFTSQIYSGIDEVKTGLLHVMTGVVCLLFLAYSIYRYEYNTVMFVAKRFIHPLMKSKTN